MSNCYIYRWVGLVISKEAAADWAFRITGKRFHLPDEFYDVQQVIQSKARPQKADFYAIGDTLKELALMVITQAERLHGYRKGDLITPFEEGEREARARPLLDLEGLTDYEFQTVRMGSKYPLYVRKQYSRPLV